MLPTFLTCGRLFQAGARYSPTEKTRVRVEIRSVLAETQAKVHNVVETPGACYRQTRSAPV